MTNEKANGTASKMAERIEYKGYRLEVGPVGKGWRAAIYAPGSATPLRESHSMLEKSSKDDIVTEAKSIIDARHGRSRIRGSHGHHILRSPAICEDGGWRELSPNLGDERDQAAAV
jgi:hypothetical protein